MELAIGLLYQVLLREGVAGRGGLCVLCLCAHARVGRRMGERGAPAWHPRYPAPPACLCTQLGEGAAEPDLKPGGPLIDTILKEQ